MDEPKVDGSDTPAPEVSGPPAVIPTPVVVVRYRRSWSATLLPPMLIVLVALALFRVRLNERDWVGPWGSQGPTQGGTDGAEAHPKGPSPFVEPGPLVAHEGDGNGPIPLAPADEEQRTGLGPALAAAIAPVPAPSPRDVSVPVGFVPPGENTIKVSPFDLTENSDETGNANGDAMAEDAEIANEARRVREHREELEALKVPLLREDKAQAEAHRLDEYYQAVQKIREDRAPFLQELTQLIQRQGNEAGPAIVDLCGRYGRVAVPHAAVARARKYLDSRTGARLDAQAKVGYLRSAGWPEPMILEELVKIDAKSIGSRRGPKNRAAALVVAGRHLLSVPLSVKGQPAAANAAPTPDPKRPLQ